MSLREGTASDDLFSADDPEDFDDLGERAVERLRDALRTERLAGLRLATIVSLAALAVIAVLLLFLTVPPWIYGYEIGLALVALLMLLHYLTQRRLPDQMWISYLFVGLILLATTLVIFLPDLLIGTPWPVQMFLRNGTGVYYFVIIALISLNYSPGLTVWAGLAGMLCWAGVVGFFASLPDSITSYDLDLSMTWEDAQSVVLEPTYVALDVRLQDIVVILVVTGILATAVARSRRLVLRQALAERERGNLARYFPPQIVDRLSQADEPLGAVREQPVAVLFADIVGFTKLAERLQPEEVIALLRAFHRRVEQAVFSNDGTLDKFLGDGVMATFGTPQQGSRDALNALAAAGDMRRAVEDWSRKREAAGQLPVRLSVGLHYGAVVMGDIGSERRLEFAVLGDTVNVASRLESLTRRLGCQAVASGALVAQARREDRAEAEERLAAFRADRPQSLRGRAGEVEVWTSGAAPRGS